MKFLHDLSREMMNPYKMVVRMPGDGLAFYDEAYIKGFDVYDHTLLPDDYIRRSRRLLLVDKLDEVQGGVLFLEEHDHFRTRKLTPPGHGPGAITGKLIEMNGLWLSKPMKEAVRIGFWLGVCEHLFQNYHFSNIIFSYDTKKRALDMFYRAFMTHEVYHGPVPVIDGMVAELTTNERVAITTTERLREYLPEYMARRISRGMVS